MSESYRLEVVQPAYVSGPAAPVGPPPVGYGVPSGGGGKPAGSRGPRLVVWIVVFVLLAALAGLGGAALGSTSVTVPTCR